MPQALLRLFVRSLPVAAATRMTIALSNRSIRTPAQPLEQAALAAATKLMYGRTRDLAAWSWGQGPCVVLVHGWGGSAAQMAPLASAIAAAGFRAVALDVTGHGASAGQSTAWSFFVRDVAALAESLGVPIHAFVGHSAGGLATMAARRGGRIRAERFVCIAAPSYPYPPVVAVQRRLGPPAPVLQEYQRYLAAQLGSTWEELEAGAAFRASGSGLLLVYDHNDRYVEHTQADRIAGLSPGAIVVKTTGHSHTRVLGAQEAIDAVCRFIGVGSSEVAPAQTTAPLC